MNEIDELVKSMRRSCFFCSQPIAGKKTQEHIIPNSLLGKLGIKEHTVVGKSSFQYSRVKVPAHATCNSSFGSFYESEIIKLLEDTDKLYYDLKIEENRIPIQYSPSDSITMLVSTWLSKIYYGLFYNDFLKIDDDELKETAKSIIDTDNFRIIQNAYKDGVGFCLPSSLYVFKSNQNFFDLQTIIYPQTILMKVNTLIMILCIEDGFLTKKYLGKETLSEFREKLEVEGNNNDRFPLHLFALSEILALRLYIPKTPSFIYSDKQIANMSFFTLVQNPKEFYKVDGKQIAEKRNEILRNLIGRIENNSES